MQGESCIIMSHSLRPDSFLGIFCPLQRAEYHQHQQRSHHWPCLCVHKHVSDHDQYSSKSIGSDYNMIAPSSDGCLHGACNNVNCNLEVSFKLQPDSFSSDQINSGLHCTNVHYISTWRLHSLQIQFCTIQQFQPDCFSSN